MGKETQLNTRELASRIGNKPHTLHAAVCRKGHYFGLVPEKLPNGMLIWPDDSVDRLLEYTKENGATDRTKRACEAMAKKRASAKANITTEAFAAKGPAAPKQTPKSPGRPHKNRSAAQADTAMVRS
jgi:hypothetical protein